MFCTWPLFYRPNARSNFVQLIRPTAQRGTKNVPPMIKRKWKKRNEKEWTTEFRSHRQPFITYTNVWHVCCLMLLLLFFVNLTDYDKRMLTIISFKRKFIKTHNNWARSTKEKNAMNACSGLCSLALVLMSGLCCFSSLSFSFVFSSFTVFFRLRAQSDKWCQVK